MTKFRLLFMMVMAAFSFQACNNAENKTETDSVENAKEINEETNVMKEDDTKFMVTAASGSMMEIALGQMAQQKRKANG